MYIKLTSILIGNYNNVCMTVLQQILFISMVYTGTEMYMYMHVYLYLYMYMVLSRLFATISDLFYLLYLPVCACECVCVCVCVPVCVPACSPKCVCLQ